MQQHALTQVRLSNPGMSGHKKYEKVFMEEVSAFEGQHWWADAARPFPHKHVVRPTVSEARLSELIDSRAWLRTAHARTTG